jgi:hypothetical protein
MSNVVEITIFGGCAEVSKRPPHIKVIVKDYDTEGHDLDRIEQDENGQDVVIWEEGPDE